MNNRCSKISATLREASSLLEKKLVKVLKGLAEYNDQSLGELLELIAIHALKREHAFTQDSLPLVKKMKDVYGMNYDVHAYEEFVEAQR